MFNKNYGDVFHKMHRKVIFKILLAVIVFVIFQVVIYRYQVVKVKEEINFVGNTLVNELERVVDINTTDSDKFFNDIIEEDIREKYNISILDSNGQEFYKVGEGQGDYIYRNKVHIKDNYWTIKVGLKPGNKEEIIIYVILISLLLGLIFIALFYMKYKILVKNKDINDLIKLKDELRQEIENRKTVEEDLSKLAAIIESSRDAILGLNLDGDIITWNIGAERMYGYKEEEVKGKNISLLIPERKRSEIFNAMIKVRCGETVDYFETERKKRNGEGIHVSTTISLVRDRDEKIIGFSEITKDITEHKKMEQNLHNSYEELSAVYQQLSATEEELRVKFDELQKNDELLKKSDQRYELVISASSDGIYDWDIKNDEMYHSKSWKTMIGYKENELADLLETWKNHILP